jgi:hypothetical protein
MRYWIDLLEMPINVSLRGGEDEGSFRKDDITLATNDKSRAKIAKIWHTSQVDVDLYLLNDASVDDRNGILGQAIKNSAIIPKVALRKLNIIPRPDAISLLLTQNEGDQRMPLTGWMIAHRLYHALEQIGEHIKNVWHPQQLRTYPQIKKRLSRSQSFVSTTLRLAVKAGGFRYSDLQRVGTTRAARDANLSNMEELVPEAFAQYILSGKVMFSPMASADADPAILAELNAYIERMQGVMMREFQTLIDYAKGKALRL